MRAISSARSFDAMQWFCSHWFYAHQSNNMLKVKQSMKFGFNTINSPKLCHNNINLRKVLMQSNVVAYWILVSDEFEFLICYILGHFIIRSNFRILLMMDSSVIVFHLIGWVCSKEYSFFQSLLQKHFYTEKSSRLKGLLNLRET